MDPPAFLASTTRWWRSKEQGVGIATLRPTTAPTMSSEAPESSFGGATGGLRRRGRTSSSCPPGTMGRAGGGGGITVLVINNGMRHRHQEQETIDKSPGVVGQDLGRRFHIY